ncbi:MULTISPECIES: ParB/RepB/Spo0J family partition protein [Bacillus amyloliquefaciens group]|jgi:ParB family chromosome partitioning protein|uniref:ParB/RepB/Spo0J family partition protein n=1 Tax=Bacillus amyloliquefaciens group TaxID=1938374 RepID=UPI0004589901|nr:MULTISPECIES: ParB/RepB/Spo0J family partition protein [Bacillus amyloliquefaciens group]AIW39476.1 plasmid partitioning protein ParB [Bacillus subtilis]AHZ18096.1 Stage 0 sporulation protein J [Bacillus velezensis SQR9]AKF74672.1 plasmid partitioning protein ParB [Bacillus velezensis]AVM10136.1 ParB/RepB/Spo0J family partition protein [Bacillus velezensis]AWD13809.1 chromosome partitioning protein ParB [Bacillus velezensis]
MAKGGLGKGINALFNQVDLSEETVEEIKISDLRPNPYQPRKQFDDESLAELKESIIQHGILQPIIVRKSLKGYDIVAGERRYRAARLAGKETVPAIVRDLSESLMREIALLENLQREDLSPLEEALAYDSLLKHLDLTQEQLAKRLGKSRPHIANHLRLLTLPESIQNLIAEGTLSMGHGRTLLGLKNKNKLEPLVKKVVEEQLNVRQLEQLIQQLNNNVPRETKKKEPVQDVVLKERESYLQNYFGTTVNIKRQKKKGKIEIEFFSNEDLERILELLSEREA